MAYIRGKRPNSVELAELLAVLDRAGRDHPSDTHHIQRIKDIVRHYFQGKNDTESFGIPGLHYISKYISNSEEKYLLHQIYSCGNWDNDLQRETQQYGYKYDYKKRRIDTTIQAPPFPEWAEKLAQRLFNEKHLPYVPNQLILNKYEPHQGITPHCDHEKWFSDCIASISLASDCVMDFAHRGSKQEVAVLLEPRSLLVLQGDARYQWTHRIKATKTHLYQGRTIDRQTRVSLTFRKVVLQS